MMLCATISTCTDPAVSAQRERPRRYVMASFTASLGVFDRLDSEPAK